MISRLQDSARDLEPDPLPKVQIGVMRQLWQGGWDSALNASELARRSGYPRTSVASALKALEARGYVTHTDGYWTGQFKFVSMPHRAQMLLQLDAETPENARIYFGPPTRIARGAAWLIEKLLPLLHPES